MQMFLTFKKLNFSSLQLASTCIHGLYLCSPLDFINQRFEDHEAESSDVTPLSHRSVWCSAGPSPHFTLFSGTQSSSRAPVGKILLNPHDPFNFVRRRSVNPVHVATSSWQTAQQRPQMKAAALENGSISDLWIFFKEHLIPYSTGEYRGTAPNAHRVYHEAT